MVFHEGYEACTLMWFIELCDLARIQCRDLLGLEHEGTLNIINPNNTQDYVAQSGYGVWRLFKLEGDQVLVEPIETAVVVPKRKPVAEGATMRVSWKAEVVSLVQLCEAVAAGNAAQQLVQPNMVALNMMARAQKQGMHVPGVRAVKEETMQVRS